VRRINVPDAPTRSNAEGNNDTVNWFLSTIADAEADSAATQRFRADEGHD
jgi:hypothetical protein